MGPHFDGQQLKILERTKDLVRQVKCLIKEHEIKQRAKHEWLLWMQPPIKRVHHKETCNRISFTGFKRGMQVLVRTTQEHQTNWEQRKFEYSGLPGSNASANANSRSTQTCLRWESITPWPGQTKLAATDRSHGVSRGMILTDFSANKAETWFSLKVLLRIESPRNSGIVMSREFFTRFLEPLPKIPESGCWNDTAVGLWLERAHF